MVLSEEAFYGVWSKFTGKYKGFLKVCLCVGEVTEFGLAVISGSVEVPGQVGTSSGRKKRAKWEVCSCR